MDEETWAWNDLKSSYVTDYNACWLVLILGVFVDGAILAVFVVYWFLQCLLVGADFGDVC